MMDAVITNQVATLEFQDEHDQNICQDFCHLFQEIQSLKCHQNKIQEASKNLLEFFIDFM